MSRVRRAPQLDLNDFNLISEGRTKMSFNKITIVGYLGRDPELRYTPQGTAVCNFSVATTEKRRNARGQTEEHTIWFRVVRHEGR